MSEAVVKINGVVLNDAQVMALRVAVSNFRSECLTDVEVMQGLGYDLSQLYATRLGEVERKLVGQ